MSRRCPSDRSAPCVQARPNGVRRPATAEHGLPPDGSAARPQSSTEVGAATPSETRRGTAAGMQVGLLHCACRNLSLFCAVWFPLRSQHAFQPRVGKLEVSLFECCMNAPLPGYQPSCRSACCCDPHPCLALMLSLCGSQTDACLEAQSQWRRGRGAGAAGRSHAAARQPPLRPPLRRVSLQLIATVRRSGCNPKANSKSNPDLNPNAEPILP